MQRTHTQQQSGYTSNNLKSISICKKSKTVYYRM